MWLRWIPRKQHALLMQLFSVRISLITVGYVQFYLHYSRAFQSCKHLNLTLSLSFKQRFSTHGIPTAWQHMPNISAGETLESALSVHCLDKHSLGYKQTFCAIYRVVDSSSIFHLEKSKHRNSSIKGALQYESHKRVTGLVIHCLSAVIW